MATETVLTKRVMLDAFRQKANPTLFLSSWFRTPPQNITNKKKVVIDVKRNEEMIAVDVIRSTGGNFNNNKRFTTKEYEPPMYNEYASVMPEELLDRLPGMTEYSEIMNAAQLLAIITDDQVELKDKILRAIEWQAANVLFTGTNILINNDTIDFKQKGTHSFNAATSWATAGSADPIADLATALELNRKDGKVNSNIVVFGKQAWNDFLNIDSAKEKFNFRRVNLIDIGPPVFNELGATFHGMITVGSYEVQAWTYPQYYLVPSGFSLPNQGTLQPYVPTDLVLVIPSPELIRMDLVFAGIPDLTNRVDPVFASMFNVTSIPTLRAIDFHPYAFTDDKKLTMEYGVRSAPLCIPTQIDGYSVIDSRP